MLQKEYENNQSKVNQIKEELNEVGLVLKKCEDEIYISNYYILKQ